MLRRSGSRLIGRRVLAIGNTVIDTVLTMDRAPVDDKVWVQSKKRFVGGQAANCAQGMALLGLDVSFMTRMGDDDDGKWARRHYQSMGIDVTHCMTVPGSLTMSASVVISTSEQTRACLMHKDESMFAVDVASLARSVDLARYDVVYSDGIQVDLARGVLEEAYQRGLPTVVDLEVVDSVTTTLCDVVSHLVAPALSVCKLANTDDPAAAVVALANERRKVVVATEGARGSYGARPADASAVHVPACSCQVKDTVGAGDAYHAGFIDALSRGCSDLRELMLHGTRVAAANCETPGPVVGVDALRRWCLV